MRALAAAIVLVACGESKPPIPASAAAGKVLEVSGAVAVAGKPLRAGDTVGATDTIDTGADGSVVIELVHNHVRLELGPNKHVRVDSSVAWGAPMRVEPGEHLDTATIAAGRAAERSAANTTTSSSAQQAVPPPSTEPTRDETKRDEPADQKTLPPVTTVVPHSGTSNGKKAQDSIGLGGQGGGEGVAGIGATSGAGYGAGGDGAGVGAPRGIVTLGTTQASAGLAATVAQRIVKQHTSEVRYCYERSLAANSTIAGAFVLELAVDVEGKVTSAKRADGTTVTDATLEECITGRARNWKFPVPDGGAFVTVTAPFKLTSP